MAALCYDPLGQGERDQVRLADGRTSPPNHTILGVSCIPLGISFAQFRIWDGMRALDYLASRPEVDAARLGCTGNSGGGTLTCYLMALDERIACAAPSCYVTSMRSLLENNGPQDAEQNIFGQVAFGMTHSEYAMMRAPKPTLFCTATHDSFGIEGAWDSFCENKRFYARFGYPERMNLVETDEGHGCHVQLREGSARRAACRRVGTQSSSPQSSCTAPSDSWTAVVRDRQGCGIQLFNTVHGSLAVYDLSDLRRVIGPQKLSVVDPRGSQDEPLMR